MLQHLIFYLEKVFNHYLLSRAEGQINQSRLFYAFVNVHNVNVKPSIFDVICRLSTTESIIEFFNVTSESLQHIS